MMKTDFSQQQIKFAIIIGLLLTLAIFILAGGGQWLDLEHLKANRHNLLAYADEHYAILFFMSSLIYIVCTTLSFPGATVLSLGIGFIFGRWVGTLLIVVSASIGATLVFCLARYLFADWAREKLMHNTQSKKLMSGFEHDAFNYLLFLRLVPLFPFWLVNLAPAFTPVSLNTYLLSTFIGIIPGSFVFANLGQSLADINSLDQLLSLPVLFALALLSLLALSPVLLKYYKQFRATQHENS